MLTLQGLVKLENAKAQIEAKQRQGARLTLDNMSTLTGLAPFTLMRLFAREEGVDKQTLRRCFRAFELALEPSDYQSSQLLSATPLAETSERLDSPAGFGLELPKGQVPLDSLFYIDRPPLEEKCYEAIQEPGALIRIKGPQQMGKTSLMVRILAKAREQGSAIVTMNFSIAEEEYFSSLRRLLYVFCVCTSKSLGLPNRLEELWDDMVGNSYNTISYFEQYLLPSVEGPVVLAFDDLERVFQYPTIAADFLGLLRVMHEKTKYGDAYSAAWQKLKIVVVHSTEAYIPLKTHQSPFNVGLSIDLPEFTQSQVLNLVNRHQLDWEMAMVDQLMNHVGGHPMLVRQGLYHIARQETSLADLVAIASDGNAIYGDHLRHLLMHLQQRPELTLAFRQVLKSPEPVQLDPIAGLMLQGLGLIHLQDTMATPSCQLYLQYFRDIL
jgi:AAA-like domain